MLQSIASASHYHPVVLARMPLGGFAKPSDPTLRGSESVPRGATARAIEYLRLPLVQQFALSRHQQFALSRQAPSKTLITPQAASVTHPPKAFSAIALTEGARTSFGCPPAERLYGEVMRQRQKVEGSPKNENGHSPGSDTPQRAQSKTIAPTAPETYQEVADYLNLATLSIAESAQAITLQAEPCLETSSNTFLLKMKPSQRTDCLQALRKLLSEADPASKVILPDAGDVRDLLKSARSENAQEFDLRTFKMLLDPVHDELNGAINALLKKLENKMIKHPVLPFTPEIRELSNQIVSLDTQQKRLKEETQQLSRLLPVPFERFVEKPGL